ncbi:hypothetical protein B7494_g4361 [Chlorociboria aeruginascens]|nr:hypothetical protein B7494_g4361 [Chlorociboria aeruginascens]
MGSLGLFSKELGKPEPSLPGNEWPGSPEAGLVVILVEVVSRPAATQVFIPHSKESTAVFIIDRPRDDRSSTGGPDSNPQMNPILTEIRHMMMDGTAGSTSSVTSSILDYRELHGRTYQNFKSTEYWAPNDEIQNDQLDIGHHMMTMMLNGKLFLAPIENPQKVIDVGTGTGIWAMDFADEFPSSEVIGTDLSNVQPRFVPPNCRFELDDAQLPWTFAPESFDFVHIRCLFGGISDWPFLYREIYKCMKPGGYVQDLEFSVEFKCDDGSVPKDSVLWEWGHHFLDAGVKMGKEFSIVYHTKQYMTSAAFVDIQERKFKLPVGPWSSDKRFKEVGLCNHYYMMQGLEGMCLLLFTKVLGWSYEAVQVFLARVRSALRDKNQHPYYEAPEISKQLAWQTIGPLLARDYTVIATDNRGMGDSSVSPLPENYTSAAMADDLKGVLDFLNITRSYVFSHDKGVGIAAALAAKYPSVVARLGLSEYVLPGYGYESFSDPAPTWTLESNWQLAFFSVVDAAQYFIQGREKEMLSWYFFHISYSGTSAISENDLDIYTSQISKPGFLRSGLNYFSNPTVAQDAAFFNATIGRQPLEMPLLVMGGEASLAPVSLLQSSFGSVGTNVSYDIVPKAGHWIGMYSPRNRIELRLTAGKADENPVWVANRVLQFFDNNSDQVPAVDLSYLADKVTLVS